MLVESIYRAMNGLRKIAAGLQPFSESVWPGARTDLFVAHESLYELFSAHGQGRIVLDAGCGTGYGAYKVANSGASQVLGVDVDARSVAYARRRYIRPNLAFRVEDIEKLIVPSSSFDLVIASNSLEHLSARHCFSAVFGTFCDPADLRSSPSRQFTALKMSRFMRESTITAAIYQSVNGPISSGKRDLRSRVTFIRRERRSARMSTRIARVDSQLRISASCMFPSNVYRWNRASRPCFT